MLQVLFQLHIHVQFRLQSRQVLLQLLLREKRMPPQKSCTVCDLFCPNHQSLTPFHLLTLTKASQTSANTNRRDPLRTSNFTNEEIHILSVYSQFLARFCESPCHAGRAEMETGKCLHTPGKSYILT